MEYFGNKYVNKLQNLFQIVGRHLKRFYFEKYGFKEDYSINKWVPKCIKEKESSIALYYAIHYSNSTIFIKTT